MFDERRVSHRVALWLLDRAPMWLRSRWPLRRFYWQQGDIDDVEIAAARWRDELL